MPAKTKIEKIFKDTGVPVPPPFTRAHVKLAGLYLLALRSHFSDSQSLPRRKMVIPIDGRGGDEGHPQIVKINHA